MPIQAGPIQRTGGSELDQITDEDGLMKCGKGGAGRQPDLLAGTHSARLFGLIHRAPTALPGDAIEP
jgi:hypothetical protein